MANTLSGLIPTIYTALDVVSREQIGFIPNVNRDATASQGAVGQTVRSPIVPAASLEDITPGNTPADSGDQTIGYADVTITKSKAYPIRWTGEEQLSVSQFGMVNTILADQFAQGFRTIANAVETDLAAMAKTRASRAYGTAGTTPFATAGDLSDLSEINRILDDNGAPATGRIMVLNSAARAKLEGKHSELFKVNEAGDAGAMLRQRQMRELQGFTMGYSAGLVQHVKGAATGQLINGAEVAGQTTLTLDTITVNTTGIKAGDIITHASDAVNKYVVNTGLVATSGDIVIGNPGLIIGAADNDAITIGNSYTPNIGFTRNAFVLAARVPAMPEGGDDADDVTLVTDPISGLVFQIAMYRQYRRIKIEIGLAWGVAGVKSEHAAIMLG
ncbi:P22 phage major capsid protein family protein [Ancylobacter sp. VNQ12]|uniref:P22 phage major capsid protein family protein n=1 Tax=Ancylobacter sp. VNQ12 TaxID=3400920 RepID=UPI003C09B109